MPKEKVEVCLSKIGEELCKNVEVVLKGCGINPSKATNKEWLIAIEGIKLGKKLKEG